MTFTVRLSDADGWLEFSHPRHVLRATDAAAFRSLFASAEAALASGLWIAGVIPYEHVGAAIGVFDAPVAHRTFDPKPFALAPLLRTVTRDAYDTTISEIQRAIYDGEVYQVNYTVPFDAALEGDAFSCWFSLARQTQARYQAFVEDGNHRILSWSPELFLAFNGSKLTTRPMKGTSPPNDTAPLHDQKDRAEHIMIVDLLRNDLHRVCDDVRVSALCTIERYPTFATMTSTIEGTAREGTTLHEIFDATFPCGSVTGAPKRAAIETIAALEGRPRGAYCGAIGYLSPQRRGWWNVAIRTAQFEGTTGRFDAGGGIVSDSSADEEWHEIDVKRAFLNSANVELWESFAADTSVVIVDAHLERLSASAKRLDIPLDVEALRRRIAQASQPAALLRVRVSLDGTFTVRCEPLDIQPSVVDVRLSTARVHSGDPWLKIKSSWRPAHRIAWDEAQHHGCFDALLLNERDELTEGSRTNVFAQIGDLLITPPLESGLLPGILRARLLADKRAVERVLSIEDLRAADALYVGNSARGLVRARLQD